MFRSAYQHTSHGSLDCNEKTAWSNTGKYNGASCICENLAVFSDTLFL